MGLSATEQGNGEQEEAGARRSLRLIRAPGGPPTPRSAFRDGRPVAGPQRPSTPGDGSHQQHIYTPFTQRLERPSAGVYAFPGRLPWSISGASLTAKRAQGASAVSPCLRRQLGGRCAWRSGDWGGGCRGSPGRSQAGPGLPLTEVVPEQLQIFFVPPALPVGWGTEM